ncbi:hypothetical protein JX265_010177 [Neoarthrinium moseri]|uniref:Uncharacterized protein n=1 Tax=Neoarthrinium moseri TaxID=1658444 RepID=A0A9Q0ALW3_9PEZI|nr:uncharacterized protein JN550_010417 [Neoarthrinium moseri]KAI1844392.1 hypothetical protein JX266_009486 [Neoarthrinium moseri]KAI1859728.1 hypothetical protein JX265_010177 [Neoarthrinium moseri]KAI1862114.1 hypothetical protein JN550_010417 [Neoarthrinium moseri]
MPPTSKPKLAQLTTPVTATFPSELSALSARTPRSAVPDFIKEEYSTKTPISPPTAYMDFLRAMSVASPVVPEKRSGSSSEEEEDHAQDSMPSTASSEHTDCSCNCGNHKSPTAVPPSPYPTHPMSAPPTGATSFPSLHIPPSPAVSTMDSPMSATARSPFSARSVRSPFDWESALKSRYSQDCKATKSSNRSVRHIREVVTRTVTYTPRMNPAPKGKRRRTECSKVQALKAAQAVAAAAGETKPQPTTRSNSA